MINPIHEELPPFAILLQVVCNVFDHAMVREQWYFIKDFYNQFLFDMLRPLVGHASDGDSRCRKLHLETDFLLLGHVILLNVKILFSVGNWSIFKGKCLLLICLTRTSYITVKKLVNDLMHPSRVLSLGGNLCFMNHLQLLINNDNLTRFYHGLQQTDVDRKDRMNWESAQRILFSKVRDCLSKIDRGEVLPQENTSRTIAHLEMTWRYIEIFYSLTFH